MIAWLRRLRQRLRPDPAPNDGARAERLAEGHLRAAGMRLKARNVRARRGECDLLMEHRGVLVFVEVRYRHHDSHGSPQDSVDRRKQQRILACANEYLARHPALARQDWRFDLVCLSGSLDAPRIEWIADAFRG
jgi:putative endonuclease